MKDIKDYLHLYLGCEVKWGSDTVRLIDTDCTNCNLFRDNEKFNTSIKNIKPILRPLNDITEEEIKKLRSFNHYSNPTNRLTPEGVRYLLSKHFDLFGLIEDGLALDKTTLK